LVTIQILPGIDRPELCTRKLLAVVSVFLSLSFCLEFPMALAAFDRPSATGSLSVVVESMSTLFGRRVGWTENTPLGSFEGAAFGSEVMARMILLR